MPRELGRTPGPERWHDRLQAQRPECAGRCLLSISVYNAEGYFQKNDLDAYSLNNITARKARDGAVTIQFGGCDGKIPNCLPIMNGWNYTVRLYCPRSRILDGTRKFPEAQPAG